MCYSKDHYRASPAYVHLRHYLHPPEIRAYLHLHLHVDTLVTTYVGIRHVVLIVSD